MLDGQVFKFTASDFDKIKTYKWRFARGRVVSYGDRDRKEVELSRTIMADELDKPENKGKQVIFKNKNTLDYRRSNLVLGNSQQRAFSSKKSSNNTSGVTGVNYNPTRSKSNPWRAYIYINRKQINLGWHSTFEDAVIARLKDEIQYCGKFAPQQHLFEEYGLDKLYKDTISEQTKKNC